VAGRHSRRAMHRGSGSWAGLLEAFGTDGGEVRGQSVWRGEAVSDRGSVPVAGRREPRIPWPDRSAGEDPGPPDRAGRDRERAGGERLGAAGGGGGAGGRRQPEAGGLRGEPGGIRPGRGTGVAAEPAAGVYDPVAAGGA